MHCGCSNFMLLLFCDSFVMSYTLFCFEMRIVDDVIPLLVLYYLFYIFPSTILSLSPCTIHQNCCYNH